MEAALVRERHRLALCIEKMKGLSPLNKLSHGYAYVQSESGEALKSIRQAENGRVLNVYVGDGRIEAKVQAAEPVVYPAE